MKSIFVILNRERKTLQLNHNIRLWGQCEN